MNNQSSIPLVVNNFALQLIIFLEGFVTISFEILSIRQLIPVVGNSVIVTSLIIGVFLLFLAYGYRKGGTYQTNFPAILKYNFLMAAFGIGIGLSYNFIAGFFRLILPLFYGNILPGLLVYLLLVTAPLVYLLGQTVPITLNLCRQQQSVAALSAKVLHISTLGSFAGAVLTSLVLMNYLGVAWTVFINYFILALLTLLLLRLPKEIIYVCALITIGLMTYGANIYLEKRLFVWTDSYANYQVTHSQPGKILFINDAASSAINEKAQGFPYIETIKTILFNDLKLHDKNILVLGAGGFSLSAGATQGNQFTYVDIDPAIKAVIEKHFLKSVNGRFIAADARAYLSKVNASYDVIVGDTYSSKINIPAHLLTQEYFAAVYRALKPDGTAVFNIAAKPTLADDYSKRIDNTIRSMFKNCMVIPVQYIPELTNIIYVCQKTFSEKDDSVYTDNRNQSTVDFFKFK